MSLLAGGAAACAAASVGLDAARAQGDVWREYRRDDLGFRVEMPGAPKVTVEEDAADGVRTKSIVADVEHEQMTLSVQYQEWRDFMSPDRQYRDFGLGMQLGGMPVTSDASLLINGLPAREYVRESDDINFIHRMVAVDKLTISASVFGDRSIHRSPTVRRFLTSFTLLRGAR
jgi:hypothetical protein